MRLPPRPSCRLRQGRSLGWCVVRGPRAGTRRRKGRGVGLVRQSSRRGGGGICRHASLGAALPHRQRAHRPGTCRLGGGGTEVCLPVQAWLVWSAARDDWGRGQRRALAALAGVTVAMAPLAGLDGLGLLYVLAALVLIALGRPWSLLVFVALVLVPMPVALATEHWEWASYFTLGVPLAAVVWLIRAAEQLQAARSALAEQAVVGERLRVDGELRHTVGAALEAIAGQGDHATALAANYPSATAQQLQALVGAARRTLADPRRMVSRYQQASLRGELEAAVSLLAAAGLQPRLVVASGDLPDRLDQAAQAMLRRDLTRLLDQESARSMVTITVARRTGGVQVELRSTSSDPAARK